MSLNLGEIPRDNAYKKSSIHTFKNWTIALFMDIEKIINLYLKPVFLLKSSLVNK